MPPTRARRRLPGSPCSEAASRRTVLAAGLRLRSLAANYARLSLASLTAPFPDTPGDRCGNPGFPRCAAALQHWLGADCAKTAAADDRAGATGPAPRRSRRGALRPLRAPDGLVLNASLDLCTSGLLDRLELLGARRVPRLSAEAWDLWEAGLDRFAAWAEAPASLPDRPASLPLGRPGAGGGRSRPARRDRHPAREPTVPAADHDALLGRFQDRFLAMIPRAEWLEAPADLCCADPDHRWGLGPFHFIPAYHAAVARDLGRLPGTGSLSMEDDSLDVTRLALTQLASTRLALDRAARAVLAERSPPPKRHRPIPSGSAAPSNSPAASWRRMSTDSPPGRSSSRPCAWATIPIRRVSSAA